MIAERTTLASATRTSGSFEVGEDVLLSYPLFVQLVPRATRQLGVDALPHVVWDIRSVPREEETGRLAIAGYQKDLVAAHHLCGSIPKVSQRHYLHVVTSVVTVPPWQQPGPGLLCPVCHEELEAKISLVVHLEEKRFEAFRWEVLQDAAMEDWHIGR